MTEEKAPEPEKMEHPLFFLYARLYAASCELKELLSASDLSAPEDLERCGAILSGRQKIIQEIEKQQAAGPEETRPLPPGAAAPLARLMKEITSLDEENKKLLRSKLERLREKMEHLRRQKKLHSSLRPGGPQGLLLDREK